MKSYPKIAPMHEQIDEYASSTNRLCLHCRSKGRFRHIQRIAFREEGAKREDVYFVCPHCDVSEDALEVA